MQKLTILNSREIKKFNKILESQFGSGLEGDYAYLINSKDRVFVVNKDISKINLENLRIDKMGLYLAEYKGNHVRLSKQGAQLFVKNAKKVTNTINLSENEAKKYFKGEDLPKDLGEDRLVILLYNKNVLGCASYKEGVILNFMPKIHRGEAIL